MPDDLGSLISDVKLAERDVWIGATDPSRNADRIACALAAHLRDASRQKGLTDRYTVGNGQVSPVMYLNGSQKLRFENISDGNVWVYVLSSSNPFGPKPFGLHLYEELKALIAQ